jgi:hypothetical protein
MSNLWAFGCSNTASYDDDSLWNRLYVKWKGYIPKVYVDYIGERFNLNVINLSKAGTNNYSIFQKICDNVDNIYDDDLVIVQWTQYTRFRLVNNNNNWEDFFLNYENYKQQLENCSHLSEKTIQEVFVNRLNNLYLEEVKSWEKIIRKALPNNKILFWSPFDEIYGHGKIVKSLETITMETNKEIVDPHFSENGHILLSEILLSEINNTKKSFI